VRHPEAGLVDDLVPGENQVDVERSRGVGAGPRPAMTLFDVEKRIEQLARRAGRTADPCRVEIGRIVFQSGADRRRFNQERELKF
jgi:hypothetical protein